MNRRNRKQGKMFEGDEEIESGGIEASPEPVETESPEVASEATKEAKPVAETETDEAGDNAPFNKHPRFRELIESNRAAKAEAELFRTQMQQMQAQLEAMKPKDVKAEPENPFLKRAKEIDPEFAEFVQANLENQKKLAALEAKLEAQSNEDLRVSAVNTVNSLYDKHKVPEKLREFYTEQIRLAASFYNVQTVDKIPILFDAIHKQISPFLTEQEKVVEAAKREDRKQYAQAKKTAASLPPTQPKGEPVEPGKKFQYSKDPETARAQMVERTIKRIQAARDI